MREEAMPPAGVEPASRA